MFKSMRQSTLETLGLGNTIDIFQNGKLPVKPSELIDEIFGNVNDRGALVISGANGIVGAGKMMQLGSRLLPFGITLIGIDFPGASDGLTAQYHGLIGSFGKNKADEIMSNVIRFNYDGKKIPQQLKKFNPKVLIEAIPEILEIKKLHYKTFKEVYPELEIRSVTSGFPATELGVGITHPAFPHQINKVWEVVEKEPSKFTKLLWVLGLLPMPVNDNWSFVLDVLFCGLTLAGIRYHDSSNMPYWKIDKYVRKLIGPNPFRAHDVIGAKGANFLTWSCLNDLSKHYGKIFEPSPTLIEHKNSGRNWYPPNHLRPIINWQLNKKEFELFETYILGSLIHKTSLLLHEKRAHLTYINSIGELCAQFRSGIIATIRKLGYDSTMKFVNDFHKLFPEKKEKSWYPEVFENTDNHDWQQLYVNAEHNGNVGIITIGRESYNQDVNDELNRAIDWLKNEKIERVILTGDFHLATQLVGADTNDFFPALNDEKEGFRISYEWSKTARRFTNEFKTSVGFINGKRCLGGMLELMQHCQYIISVKDVDLGAPEVTLPVVPGMEMCHYPFRKTKPENWQKLANFLLTGKFVKASETVGWLVDYSGGLDEALKMAWEIANNGQNILNRRELTEEPLNNLHKEINNLQNAAEPSILTARAAIFESIINSCSVNFGEVLEIQARLSAKFMISKECQNGFIGNEYNKTMNV